MRNPEDTKYVWDEKNFKIIEDSIINNKTFTLELSLKEKEGETIHTIGLPHFKLEEIGLCFFDDMLKVSKEALFDILRKKYKL